jgi:hypothetical protein
MQLVCRTGFTSTTPVTTFDGEFELKSPEGTEKREQRNSVPPVQKHEQASFRASCDTPRLHAPPGRSALHDCLRAPVGID